MKRLITNLFLVCLLAAAGCKPSANLQKLSLVPPPPAAVIFPSHASLDAEFCTRTSVDSASRQVLIFVMDKSGSNVFFPGGVPSDPAGIVRYQSLLNFLDNPTIADNDRISYGLINFSTQSRIVSPLTNDHAQFHDTVLHESNPHGATPPNPEDSGATDYIGALALARSMIVADMDAARLIQPHVGTRYSVFFISDGFPIVQGQPQSVTEILASTQSIKALELVDATLVDGIQLHAGYYYSGNADANARSLMSSMAHAGGGDFYQFSDGQQIDYSNFSLPDRLIKYIFDDVYVTNVNTIWYQGNLVLDTDGDGIPDELEVKLGSNPSDADSDHNGISDGVEYYVNGKPCTSGTCEPTAAVTYSVCQQFITSTSGGRITYVDSDHDGLNDCEEVALLKTNRNYFDSNKDGIPDSLAFFKGIAFREGQNDTSLDPDFDGLGNALEVKFNTPTNFNNTKIPGLLPYKYDLKQVSSNQEQDCYHLIVTDIPTIGSTNKLQAYLMEHPSNVDSTQYLRSAQGILTDSAGTIRFKNEDFQ